MAKSDASLTHPQESGAAGDLGLLALRLTAGGLLAGHGAQKAFGWFGGPGLAGTAGFLESMGFRPGQRWAALAAASELGGGALTALGLFGPLGPIAMQGAMIVAARRVHWGKPIWASEGGAELPVLYMGVGAALALAGPGRFSLDRAFGIRIPTAVAIAAGLAVAAGVAVAEQTPAAEPGAGSREPDVDAGEGNARV